MALFGKLEDIISQAENEKFSAAFKYLEKLADKSSEEYREIMSYSSGICKKIELDNNNFVLEQVYSSKEREECLFESHKKYIDMQFIVYGEEIIEVANSKNQISTQAYDEEKDIVIYKDTKQASLIILKAGDIAIFYPQDAHMPCIKVNTCDKVVKAVVKVKI
ncbi:MAG: YhcH/YjgK/YiaL family protein [Sulfurimonas sp.]|nr:YhcH/YjgK/YiaL family protein [Sulfurimonas sp.]